LIFSKSKLPPPPSQKNKIIEMAATFSDEERKQVLVSFALDVPKDAKPGDTIKLRTTTDLEYNVEAPKHATGAKIFVQVPCSQAPTHTTTFFRPKVEPRIINVFGYPARRAVREDWLMVESLPRVAVRVIATEIVATAMTCKACDDDTACVAGLFCASITNAFLHSKVNEYNARPALACEEDSSFLVVRFDLTANTAEQRCKKIKGAMRQLHVGGVDIHTLQDFRYFIVTGIIAEWLSEHPNLAKQIVSSGISSCLFRMKWYLNSSGIETWRRLNWLREEPFIDYLSLLRDIPSSDLFFESGVLDALFQHGMPETMMTVNKELRRRWLASQDHVVRIEGPRRICFMRRGAHVRSEFGRHKMHRIIVLYADGKPVRIEFGPGMSMNGMIVLYNEGKPLRIEFAPDHPRHGEMLERGTPEFLNRMKHVLVMCLTSPSMKGTANILVDSDIRLGAS
jgi:hypothetical protein